MMLNLRTRYRQAQVVEVGAVENEAEIHSASLKHTGHSGVTCALGTVCMPVRAAG